MINVFSSVEVAFSRFKFNYKGYTLIFHPEIYLKLNVSWSTSRYYRYALKRPFYSLLALSVA